MRVYNYSANRHVFAGSVWIRDVPGALAGVAIGLAKAGINLVGSSSSNVAEMGLSEWGFFAECEDGRLEVDKLQNLVLEQPNVVHCGIKDGDDGLVVDSLHYPLRMNTGQQVMVLRRDIFTQMFKRMREVFGSGGDVVLHELGYATGRDVVNDHVNNLGRAVLLRHQIQMGEELMAQGWGRVEVVSGTSGPMRAVFRLFDSFECAGIRSSSPNSQFFKGYVQGYVKALYGVPVDCNERRCTSMGDPYCEFEITEAAENQ